MFLKYLKFPFFRLISFFSLITHSLFGDHEIGISFVCVPDFSFSMCIWTFPNLCALLCSSVATVRSSSLTDHRLVGLCKLFETRTERFHVFLKILFVIRPALIFFNTCELDMEEKQFCILISQQLIHDPFWAPLVVIEGKASLIFCEYVNRGRGDVRTRCMHICYFDKVSLI